MTPDGPRSTSRPGRTATAASCSTTWLRTARRPRAAPAVDAGVSRPRSRIDPAGRRLRGRQGQQRPAPVQVGGGALEPLATVMLHGAPVGSPWVPTGPASSDGRRLDPSRRSADGVLDPATLGTRRGRTDSSRRREHPRRQIPYPLSSDETAYSDRGRRRRLARPARDPPATATGAKARSVAISADGKSLAGRFRQGPALQFTIGADGSPLRTRRASALDGRPMISPSPRTGAACT